MQASRARAGDASNPFCEGPEKKSLATDAAQKQRHAAAAAWNTTVLHVGSEAHDSRDARHMTLRGGLKLAFTGESSSRLPSRRYVDLRARVFFASLAAEHEALHMQVCAPKPEWRHIQRCYDDTPYHFDVRELSEDIACSARFVVPAQLRETVSKALCSYKESLQYGVRPGRHGAIDIFVTSLMVSWGTGHEFTLNVPPHIMLGRHAHFISSALDTHLDSSWSVEKIKGMARNLSVTLVTG